MINNPRKALEVLRQVSYMASDEYVDCYEIANKGLKLYSNGEILVLRINSGSNEKIIIPQDCDINGSRLEDYDYHVLYSVDGFIVEPRLAPYVFPEDDYLNHINGINRGRVMLRRQNTTYVNEGNSWDRK